MNKPIVSIIVPNYNHSIYLPLRIESILAQTYDDYELILLDDHSSDNSRQVLESYSKNPHVSHVVYNEKNSGTTFKQWEKGIALARGKYIWIAESDDFIDAGFLQETVTIMENNPDVVLVYTGSQMVNANGEALSEDWDRFEADIPFQTKHESGCFLAKKMLWKNSIYNASMVLFRSECYANVKRSYTQYRYCGDWFFWIEICRQGAVVSINRKMNYFRQHNAKVSPKSEKEGLYYMEGGEVIEHVMTQLQLSAYQKKIVAGRVLKRLMKDTKSCPDLREKAIAAHPKLLGGGRASILAYEIDKLFNFSHLQ